MCYPDKPRESQKHCTFATLSYTSIALIHLHRPSAAEEAFATILGSKSGLVMYSLRIFCITGTYNVEMELVTARGKIPINNKFKNVALDTYRNIILVIFFKVS